MGKNFQNRQTTYSVFYAISADFDADRHKNDNFTTILNDITPVVNEIGRGLM